MFSSDNADVSSASPAPPPAPTTTASTTATTTTATAVKITRGHSCLACQQRKVKCDGQRPCSTCIKHGVQCVAKPPSAPRKRKAKEAGLTAGKHDVLERIKKLEQSLEGQSEEGGLGIKIPSQTSSGQSSPPRLNRVSGLWATIEDLKASEPGKIGGQMVNEGGHSRYVENTLWAGLKDELSQLPKTAPPPVSSDDDRLTGEGLLFGSTGVLNLTASHPEPVHIFQLWQKFLENVNPLTKLFHAPTMQQVILDAVSHLDQISRSMEALLFAIYLSAVNSLKDGECQNMLGNNKKTLISRFSRATEFALSNAKFLRSYDIAILQALTLYLVAMRHRYDPQSLWLLSGLAVRSAQRIGLHRETASQGFSVFDAELRRRLWWQIMMLDGMSAKLSGAAIHTCYSQLSSDTKRPLNVNDSDLWPTMKEMPKQHTGITEMLFCSIRCELGEFLHQTRWSGTCLNGQLPDKAPGDAKKSFVSEKDKGIDALEANLEFKFLRFVDPSVSFHLLATYMAKAAVSQMRLAAHHPYQYADKGASLPQSEKDMLFSTAIDILQYHNLVNSTKGLSPFHWHLSAIIPFEAFIFVFGELAQRTEGRGPEGDLVRKAKAQVVEAYENHPELISDSGNALYFAIGNLAVRAWLHGPSASPETYPGEPNQHLPPFITKLLAQRQQSRTTGPPTTKQQPNTTSANTRTEPSSTEQYTNNENQTQYQANQNQQYQWGIENLDPNAMNSNNAGGVDATVFPGFTLTDRANPLDWDYWQCLLDGTRDLPLMDQNGHGSFSYI